MNDKAVYRTAPATPGLLNITGKKVTINSVLVKPCKLLGSIVAEDNTSSMSL